MVFRDFPWFSRLWRGLKAGCALQWQQSLQHRAPHFSLSIWTLQHSPSEHFGFFSLFSRWNGTQRPLTPQPGGAECHKTGTTFGLCCQCWALPAPEAASGPETSPGIGAGILFYFILFFCFQSREDLPSQIPAPGALQLWLAQDCPSSGINQALPPLPKSALQPSPSRENLLICV